MRRYAGSPDPRLRRRRVVAGGATALAVTFTFVAANAIWYQPHAHKAPILATRAVEPMPVPVSRPEEPEAGTADTSPPRTYEAEDGRGTDIAAIIERGTERPAPAEGGDPLVAEVQSVMAGLGLYEGEIDGLTGPMTQAAIKAYQQTIGLEATGRIDDTLLGKLGIAGEGMVPTPPRSRPDRSSDTDTVQTASLGEQGRSETKVMRIQAGLKAFGNDGIEIDGVVGPRTEAAIREFQSLFGMPVTGQPNDELYAKMREIGLTD